MDVLGLTEDELCQILDTDALTILSGQVEHEAALRTLLALLADTGEQITAPTLRRWVRASGPRGRPIELLTRRDFAAFEDALDDLARRGFVLRGGGAG